MNPYTRAHVRFLTNEEATRFVAELNSDGTAAHYTLENFNGSSRVNARSLIGVIYAMTEHGEEIYLVNDTDDGNFPASIDKYRV